MQNNKQTKQCTDGGKEVKKTMIYSRERERESHICHVNCNISCTNSGNEKKILVKRLNVISRIPMDQVELIGLLTSQKKKYKRIIKNVK